MGLAKVPVRWQFFVIKAALGLPVSSRWNEGICTELFMHAMMAPYVETYSGM
jgi:hypothetical protein